MQNQIANGLGLEGHDSEAFSFLSREVIDELTRFEISRQKLYTFGYVTPDGKLSSVVTWNVSPGCFAFTEQPPVTRSADGWINYRGCVCNDAIVEVEALTLLRYLFCQGYTCGLNGYRWVDEQADPQLKRLAHIRGYASDHEKNQWPRMLTIYFLWFRNALARLNRVVYSTTSDLH